MKRYAKFNFKTVDGNFISLTVPEIVDPNTIMPIKISSMTEDIKDADCIDSKYGAISNFHSVEFFEETSEAIDVK